MKSKLFKITILIGCAVWAAVTAQAQTINLQLQSDYTIGNAALTPRLAVGDVNNDRLPDLVTLNKGLNPGEGPVSVFLNSGTGSFGCLEKSKNVCRSGRITK